MRLWTVATLLVISYTLMSGVVYTDTCLERRIRIHWIPHSMSQQLLRDLSQSTTLIILMTLESHLFSMINLSFYISTNLFNYDLYASTYPSNVCLLRSLSRHQKRTSLAIPWKPASSLMTAEGPGDSYLLCDGRTCVFIVSRSETHHPWINCHGPLHNSTSPQYPAYIPRWKCLSYEPPYNHRKRRKALRLKRTLFLNF